MENLVNKIYSWNIFFFDLGNHYTPTKWPEFGKVSTLERAKGLTVVACSQVPGFPDTYLLVKPDQPRHHKRAFPMLTKQLTSDHRVRKVPRFNLARRAILRSLWLGIAGGMGGAAVLQNETKEGLCRRGATWGWAAQHVSSRRSQPLVAGRRAPQETPGGCGPPICPTF